MPKVILDYPEHGCINVHASLLPKYRGASPITAAIKNGEETTGITIMYMDEGIDTGNIIQAKELPILENDTLGTLSEKLSKLGAKTLIDTLPRIMECENFDIPQDHEIATYVSMLKRSDEIIDFNKTRKEVYNFVRSINPSPLAKIGSDSKGPVGRVSSINKDSFGIYCTDGEILITRVKPAGKKEMSVKDFFNGFDSSKLKDIEVGD